MKHLVSRAQEILFKINKDKIAYRLIEGEAIILNLVSGFYYSLNKTGTLIWQLIENGKNLKEIAPYLAKEFNVKEEELKRDIKALIIDLEKEGLIEKGKKYSALSAKYFITLNG